MRIRNNPARAARGDHRDLSEFGESRDLGSGLRPERPASGDDDRALRRRERRNRRTDVGRGAGGAGRRGRKPGRRDIERGGLAVQRVRIHLEVHAAGAAAPSPMERLGDVSRNPARLRTARRPLGDRLRDGELIHISDRTPALADAASTTREHDHGHAPGGGIQQADQAVGEPGARGDRRDTGVPGRQGPALRGEHRRSLMPGVDDPDVLVDAGVEKGQDMATGKGENGGHTALSEGSRHQRAAVGTLLGVGARSLGRDVRHDLRSLSTGIGHRDLATGMGDGHCTMARIE